jgi:uncharacterized protein YecE (DUF72 family)
VNPGRLQALLEALPSDLRYAFEFRDLSWIHPEIDMPLARFHAAFCMYELAGYHSPLTTNADCAYVRLHGPGLGRYQESYPYRRPSQSEQTDGGLVERSGCDRHLF